MLQIRNPMGNKFLQWGRQNSDQRSDLLRGYHEAISEKGSTFWIKFEDFVQIFDNIEVCRIGEWNEVRLRGSFVQVQYPSGDHFYQSK